MIICGRSKNPFLPECAARGQERILRAPADDHVRENVRRRLEKGTSYAAPFGSKVQIRQQLKIDVTTVTKLLPQ
ncbi:hypothetical protein DPMN_072871 [Dreissena polymorpha]|uniref:Uncharacterized protein n=1 Tax=Dreissena polymorpha TaxID=45954 RepID=A0A9D4BY22_DREPO|nr:hypothetical protein DPMN_072871 [Dreissena polymorpha]